MVCQLCKADLVDTPGVLGLCNVFMVLIVFDLLIDWRGTDCPSDRHCYVDWIRTDEDLPNVQLESEQLHCDFSVCSSLVLRNMTPCGVIDMLSTFRSYLPPSAVFLSCSSPIQNCISDAHFSALHSSYSSVGDDVFLF